MKVKTITVKRPTENADDFWKGNRLFACAEFCQKEFNIPTWRRKVEISISTQPFPGAKQMFVHNGYGLGLDKEQACGEAYIPLYTSAKEFLREILPIYRGLKRFYLKIV